MSHCPKCGYEQFCGCGSCMHETLIKGYKPWIWLEGDRIKCANCGFTAHCDYWGDLEMEEYRLSKTPKREEA